MEQLIRALTAAAAVCVVSVTLALSASAGTVFYRVQDLGTMTGQWSEAWDINSRGEVVGEVEYQDPQSHGFIWADGRMTYLTGLNEAASSAAICLNDSGEVVGYSGGLACVWREGVPSSLGTLGGTSSTATAINNFGQIVGASWLPGNSQSHAVLWDDYSDSMIDLGVLPGYEAISYAKDINDLGQIVGSSQADSTRCRPFLWENGIMTELSCLGGQEAGAQAMNDFGQVVGWSDVPEGTARHAVLWASGQVRDIGTLNGSGICTAMAINNQGHIVGYATHSGLDTAFIWRDGKMSDLNDQIAAESGWHIAQARDINELGQIVGSGILNGHEHAFLLTPVPEPSPLVVLLLGTSGMLWTRRRSVLERAKHRYSKLMQ